MKFFDFEPGAQIPLWGGGVSKLLCRLRPLCIDSHPGPIGVFHLYMDFLTNGGGPRSKLWVPPFGPTLGALADEDTAVFTPFSGSHV